MKADNAIASFIFRKSRGKQHCHGLDFQVQRKKTAKMMREKDLKSDHSLKDLLAKRYSFLHFLAPVFISFFRLPEPKFS